MKSHFLKIKWRNLQKIAKYLKNLAYQDKIGVQFCENLVFERHFNRLLYIFLFREKILSGS